MKKLLLLPFVCFCLFSFLQAQSGYIKTSSTEASEDEAIEEGLDSMDIHYTFDNPSSSIYDTIIFNKYNFRSDEVPSYRDDVYAKRLHDIPAVIPMDFNPKVKRFIELYTRERREQMSKMLGLSEVYFPIFEEALDRERMPIELKYLPIVESALNPHARSRVGATGLWQFMIATGRQYGLTVNSYVDERKNPYKSTEAALRYLKNSYEEYGDWLLAIASYNCGPGNVRKAIARSGGKKDFWAIMQYLPRETRGYVPAFIAATYAFEYASEHNLYPVYVNFDYRSDTIHIRNMDISLEEIADMSQTKVEILKQLNPELQRGHIPYSSQTYVLRAPYRVTEYFAAFPISIREKYGMKRDAYENRHTATASFTSSASSSSSSSYQPTYPSNSKLHYHTVKEGEVVGAIAEAYHVSTRSIANWNNLYRYRIKVGQKLKIYTDSKPERVKTIAENTAAPSPQPTSNGTFYHVRRGDTLWDISKKYSGTSPNSILGLNPGVNARDLKPGMSIRVK
jgi:membrane-bound lytic murein transglycosylase D